MKISSTAIFSVLVGIIATVAVVVVASNTDDETSFSTESDVNESVRKLRDETISNFGLVRACTICDDTIDGDRMLLRNTVSYGSMKNDETDEVDEFQYKIRTTSSGYHNDKERRLMSKKMMMDGKKGDGKGKMKMDMKTSTKDGKGKEGKKMKSEKKKMTKSKDGKSMKTMDKKK